MARTAAQSRPQLICILLDDSDSIAGEKAILATEAVRELILRFQTLGPRGIERSYFRFVVIRWGSDAEIIPGCNMVPARKLDPHSIVVNGDRGPSDITTALNLAQSGLADYLSEVVQPHPNRGEHPLPLVAVFTDGSNIDNNALDIADKIKRLSIDEERIPLAVIGVSTGSFDDPGLPNEERLRLLATPGCYLHVSERERQLNIAFGITTSQQHEAYPYHRTSVAEVIKRLEGLRGGSQENSGSDSSEH